MRFFSTIVGAAALISSVVAQDLGITKAPSSVQAGQTYTIEYTAPAGAAVSLILRKGDPNNLDTLTTLTCEFTNFDPRSLSLTTLL